MIAPYLTELQARVKKEGIRVGSCKCLLHGLFQIRPADLRPILIQGCPRQFDRTRCREDQGTRQGGEYPFYKSLLMELGRPGTGWQDRLGGYTRLREGDRKDLIICMNPLSENHSPNRSRSCMRCDIINPTLPPRSWLLPLSRSTYPFSEASS